MSLFKNLLNADTRKYAVAYYRHSRDKAQENSVKIQRDNVSAYAEKFNIEIIHEEIDDGISGLTDERAGFQALLDNWIKNPSASLFQYVLVNDTTRWGRWQDLDEAAFFRFMCKENGRRLICVDRGLAPKDKEDISDHMLAIVDSYKAARDSELISQKTTDGAKEVSKQGYSAGGSAPYGLKRILLDEQREFVQVMEKGQHKFIANQRVTFTPADDDTTDTVKYIFDQFVHNWRLPMEIAEDLNEKKVKSPGGKKWSKNSVLRILANEVYIGTHSYYKSAGPLKKHKKANPKHLWVIKENAFKATIDPALFTVARERLYWLSPSRWKRGIYTTRRVTTEVKVAIMELIKDLGYDADNIQKITETFPLVSSAKFYHSGTAHYCFLIDEEKRKFENILGVGISTYKTNPLDQFFLIPTKDFGLANYLVVSENDGIFLSYCLKPEVVEQEISNIIMELFPPLG